MFFKSYCDCVFYRLNENVWILGLIWVITGAKHNKATLFSIKPVARKKGNFAVMKHFFLEWVINFKVKDKHDSNNYLKK